MDGLNPFAVQDSSGAEPVKRTVEDFYQLLQQQHTQVQQQNLKFDQFQLDFAEQKQYIQGFANQLKSIAELQTTSSGQSILALNKATENQISIEKLNQKLLKNFIDVSGVPYDKDEVIIDIMCRISANIGLEISEDDISKLSHWS